ncbi:DM13 domain-containing protein [Vibrio sonorensis]|uniref:DM13 domain-containing protein n=1 Tax=Vibrio sonorensis TaxID=1004316 RepID=UPI0008D91FBE|nr:DM13 domain-containing protein [Vibrio sonorensis]
MKWILLLISHALVGIAGFSLGVYLLPILIQPDAPPMALVESAIQKASYSGNFERSRQDSDFLHWGEGSVAVSADTIVFVGELAPGPDYKLYLSNRFIETESEFLSNKAQMTYVGDVKTFDRFTLTLPHDVDIEEFNTVIVWCETFEQFITSARYK